jgi:translation initiation factor 3 subunit M
MSCRLSNLFNAIPRTSSLRLVVYNTLLDLATANNELEVLQLSRGDVEKWLSEWDITPDEKSAFLKRIVIAYQKAEQPYVPTIDRRLRQL